MHKFDWPQRKTIMVLHLFISKDTIEKDKDTNDEHRPYSQVSDSSRLSALSCEDLILLESAKCVNSTHVQM